MAQVASRFTTWLDSCQPILLSELKAIAVDVPSDIFEEVVEEVGCYGVDYDSGYMLVHCRSALWSPPGVAIIWHRFRLKYGGSLGYSQQEGSSFPAVTIQQDPNLAERLPPLLFRGRWLALRGRLVETNSPKCLRLKDIVEICECLGRREFVTANSGPFSASGPGWFYFALWECLRGCEKKFGGCWNSFYTTTFMSGWEIRAIITEAKNRYLEERHSDCCYLSLAPSSPNPSPESPKQRPTTSMMKQPSPTNIIVASHSSQPRTLASDSSKSPEVLVGTSNQGKIHAPKANKLGLSLSCPVTEHMPTPESEGTGISRQLGEVYPSTVVRISSKGKDFKASDFQEPVVAAKRVIITSEEGEGRKFEGNKRIKVGRTGAEEPRDSLALEENEIDPSASSGVSRTMSLSDVVSLLVRHGCQDISHMLDLPACSEYPISSGGFGDVFRGKLDDNTPVAIKCTRIMVDPYSSEHEKYLKYAAREIHTWSKLDHRYVSKLLGLAQFRGQIAMISPWAEHGALPGFLTRQPRQNRPQLCAQIADGLAFLHENKIVHGDLKGANVLISESYEPLLIDFGNAVLHDRSLQFTYTTAKSNFSLRWTAPELLYGAPCSFEADVYALGMTILEVITGEVPYARLHDMAVLNSINSKQHPKRPDEHIPNTSVSGEALWSLLSRCWAFEPKSRPPVEWVQDVMEMINPEGLVPGRGEEDLGISEPVIDE